MRLTRSWHLFSAFLLLLLLGGCGHKAKVVSYMLKIESSESLNQVLKKADYEVSCHYRPSRYLALRELLKTGLSTDSLERNPELVSKMTQQFSQGYYFEVRISLNSKENVIVSGIGDQGAYATRIDYLNQSIYKDFYILMDDLSKIRPLGHSFQNTFGASPYCDLAIVFPKQLEEKLMKFELVYDDIIFGMHPAQSRFSFDMSNLIDCK